MNSEWFSMYGNLSNISLIDPYWLQFPPPSTVAHVITIIFMFIVIFLSIIGNGLVIAVCVKYKNLVLSNCFVINLAVSDIVNPIATYWMMAASSDKGIWVFGRTGCAVYGFLQGYFGLMSIMTMSALSVHICVRILGWRCSRFFHFIYGKGQVLVAAVWIYCFILASPPLFGWSSYTLTGFLTTCCFDYISKSIKAQTFILFLFGFGFVVPLSALLISYVVVIKNVRWMMKKADYQYRSIWVAHPLDNYKILHYVAPNKIKVARQRDIPLCRLSTLVKRETNNLRRQTRLDLKLLRIIFVLVITFLISWTPYAVVALLGQFGPDNFVTPLMATIPAIFAKSSTIYNPFIFAFQDSKFRQTAWHFVCSSFWKCYIAIRCLE